MFQLRQKNITRSYRKKITRKNQRSNTGTSPRGRLRRLFSRSLLNTESDDNILMHQEQKSKSLQKICALCRLPVRGLVVSCSRCGCGGHVSCLRKWFESESSCPSGCDCRCSSLISTEDSEEKQQQKELTTNNELSEIENEDTTTSDEEEVFDDDESARKVEYSVVLGEGYDGQEGDFLDSYALKWGVGGVDSEW